jgi:hypothetical protein
LLVGNACRTITKACDQVSIEPTKDTYQWDAIDAFLKQLHPADEAWVVLATSSLRASHQPSDLIPSSPTKDLDVYYRFVRTVVEHCKGRVQYWQMEFEVGRLFWSGTARDYVAQFKVFSRAVKDAASARATPKK